MALHERGNIAEYKTAHDALHKPMPILQHLIYREQGRQPEIGTSASFDPVAHTSHMDTAQAQSAAMASDSHLTAERAAGRNRAGDPSWLLPLLADLQFSQRQSMWCNGALGTVNLFALLMVFWLSLFHPCSSLSWRGIQPPLDATSCYSGAHSEPSIPVGVWFTKGVCFTPLIASLFTLQYRFIFF